MIDTIRLKIPLRPQTLAKIKSKSTETVKFSHEKKIFFFRFWQKEINTGSFDRKINIHLPEDKDELYMEFSVPKFHYGHNVYMVSPEKLKDICENIEQFCLKHFGDFPPTYTWEITRLDLCYAWKLLDDFQVDIIIQSLKRMVAPRKITLTYTDSCYFKGREETIKFYAKHPEFHAHDFIDLKRLGHIDLAYEFLEKSRGVLRFETTLRGETLLRRFNTNKLFITEPKINTPFITQILNDTLKKVLFDNKITYMDKSTIYDKLKFAYGARRARHLYLYLLALNSDNQIDKKVLQMGRTQNYYIKSQILEAGVGFTIDDKLIDIKLEIPSPFATNNISSGGVVTPPECSVY